MYVLTSRSSLEAWARSLRSGLGVKDLALHSLMKVIQGWIPELSICATLYLHIVEPLYTHLLPSILNSLDSQRPQHLKIIPSKIIASLLTCNCNLIRSSVRFSHIISHFIQSQFFHILDGSCWLHLQKNQSKVLFLLHKLRDYKLNPCTLKLNQSLIESSLTFHHVWASDCQKQSKIFQANPWRSLTVLLSLQSCLVFGWKQKSSF